MARQGDLDDLLSQSEEAVVQRVRFPNGEALVTKAFRDPWPVEIRAYGLLERVEAHNNTRPRRCEASGA